MESEIEMDLSTKILSDVIVYMKYAKYIPELRRKETWAEIVTRNKNMHIKKYPHMKKQIEEAYKFVYDKKVLPSLRSMQFAGKPIEINPVRGYNCSVLSMDNVDSFSETMFLLLSGTGVGFSIQAHHVERLPEIVRPKSRTKRYLIGDSIEGWADAVKMLVRSYFEGTSTINFDYSDIRPKGALLLTSGGRAPGPQPLKDCIHNIRKVLDTKESGEKLTPLEAHDIQCYIADSVLSGGIRRAAMLSMFSFDDEEMLSCKSGSWWDSNPQRARANNSALVLRHRIEKEDFIKFWELVKANGSGEPAVFFSNDKEYLANPCAEISLRLSPNGGQFCNLCEINAGTLENQQDFNDRVAAAAFIGTLQAGYTDFHYLRDGWKKMTEKEALLGVGMTGIASGKVLELDMKEAARVCIKENERVAKEIGINKAARLTTVKPSGTSSIVLGTSSGVHAWHNDYYIRRVRVGKNEAIYKYMKEKMPELVEDDVFKPKNDAVVSFPIRAPEGANLRSETSLELLERVKKVYSAWVKTGHRKGSNTNNVSTTVSVKDDEWDEIGAWMWENRNFYNGITVLPYDGGTYVQAPFEDCTKEKYEELMAHLSKIDLSEIVELEDTTNLQGELACAGGACEIR